MGNRLSQAKQFPCPGGCGTTIAWSGTTICRSCYDKLRKHYGSADVATLLARAKNALELGEAEARNDESVVSLVPPELSSYEQAWRQLAREIGLSRDRYAGPARALTPRADGRKRYAVISDLHVPFHERAFLADFIAREQGKVDTLFINGDAMDSYSLSRFVQYEWMPFKDEMAEVIAVLDQLSMAFPDIVIVIGNHDSRLEKQVRSRLTADMAEAVSWLADGMLCPLTALVKRRYPNMRLGGHTLPSGHHIDWFTAVGDTWIGHPEAFSVVPSGALRKVEASLATHADEWGLSQARLIITGHTHQLEKVIWRQSLLVAGGCICSTQGYQVTPRITSTAQRRGYVWFEQDAAGRTDLNSVDWWWYDQDDRVTRRAA